MVRIIVIFVERVGVKGVEMRENDENREVDGSSFELI